jgi:integrase
MALTDKKIQQAKTSNKKVKLSDGNGLTLIVNSKGGKYWVHRYYFDTKRIEFNLGTYPSLSLKEARSIHASNRLMISKGINPKELKDNEKKARKQEVLNTFKSVAEKYFEEVYRPNTSQVTWKKIIPYFPKDIYTKIGKKPINDIKALDIYEACKKISDRGSKESAKRVCRMISTIYAWATLLGVAKMNIAYGLAKSLPQHVKGNFVSTTDPKDFAKILNKIDAMPNDNPYIKAYLQIMPLVFSRQGELRSMRWDEIDLNKGEWKYVVSKTKKNTNGSLHLVPLCPKVIGLIQGLIPLKTTSPYVFCSDKSDSGYYSDSAIYKHLRASGVAKEDTSLHGFRTSQRTIADEILEVNTDILEIQLSHKNPSDKHGGAYARAEFLKQRKDYMQQWSDYCDEIKNV